jgi:hypothetical protein
MLGCKQEFKHSGTLLQPGVFLPPPSLVTYVHASPGTGVVLSASVDPGPDPHRNA